MRADYYLDQTQKKIPPAFEASGTLVFRELG